MRPLPLRQLLTEAVQRSGIERQVAAAMVLEVADRAIKGLLPTERLRDAQAICYRHGVVTIHCLNASAMQAVRRGSDKIIREITNEIPRAAVTKILSKLVDEIQAL